MSTIYDLWFWIELWFYSKGHGCLCIGGRTTKY